MKKIYSYTGVVDSQLQHPGSMGCLAQGHLSRDKEVNCHAYNCLPTNRFVEQWVGIELPTLWLLDNQTHHFATANPNTNVKMYEKNTHTNIWKRHAHKNAYKITYKCMTKTRIQMYEKKTLYKCMTKTHTKSHTNVWQKPAYKCMKKTCLQMYEKNIQMYEWPYKT